MTAGRDRPTVEHLLRELAPQVLGAVARRHGGPPVTSAEKHKRWSLPVLYMRPEELHLHQFALLQLVREFVRHRFQSALADPDGHVEVVADRGFNGRVAAAEWAAVCEDMQREFRAGRYAEGVIAGVEDVGRIIGAHYPQRPGQRDEDELPNRPALL